MTYALWIVQLLLALTFAFAGGFKLLAPIEVVQEQMQINLPGVFIRFIGTPECLGALGLILPGLLRTRPILTPLAAAGLVMVMLGATMFVPAGADLSLALIPASLGVLAAFVAYGRWRVVPHRAAARRLTADPTSAILQNG